MQKVLLLEENTRAIKIRTAVLLQLYCKRP